MYIDRELSLLIFRVTGFSYIHFPSNHSRYYYYLVRDTIARETSFIFMYILVIIRYSVL